jgi:predicted glycosyltransferase
MEHFGAMENTVMVMLPRNDNQTRTIRERWPHLIEAGKVVIPTHVIDGLNLIWYSDLVISGGGTMNREAAALGVPVYSIFKGAKGGVDKYLAEHGRLVFLDTAADVHTKIDVSHRDKSHNGVPRSKVVLNRIVDEIVRIADSCNGGNGHSGH